MARDGEVSWEICGREFGLSEVGSSSKGLDDDFRVRSGEVVRGSGCTSRYGDVLSHPPGWDLAVCMTPQSGRRVRSSGMIEAPPKTSTVQTWKCSTKCSKGSSPAFDCNLKSPQVQSSKHLSTKELSTQDQSRPRPWLTAQLSHHHALLRLHVAVTVNEVSIFADH
jgi:hypothetical protein